MANPPYDPVKSFSAVSVFAFSSTAIVINPAVPAQSLKELIAYAKSNPGKLSYGSAGNGSTTNMAGELFKRLAGGLDIVHVPYKGIAQGLGDLISGQIPMFSANVTAQFLQLQQAGKLRILSVNADARLKGAPDIPTSIESGLPGMVAQTTFGIFAPAGTPAPIIARLSGDAAGHGRRGVSERTVRQGFEPMLGVSGDQGRQGVRGRAGRAGRRSSRPG